MKKRTTLFISLTAGLFSITSAHTIAVDTQKICSKGNAFNKFTLRSFNGTLCYIPPIALWAEKNCVGIDNYEKSQCHGKAVTVLKGYTGKDDVSNLSAKDMLSATVEHAKNYGPQALEIFNKVRSTIAPSSSRAPANTPEEPADTTEKAATN